MKDCKFCKIINKEIKVPIIYEDEYCFVFPDKNPIREGHILIIPKNHEPDFWKLEKNIYTHLNEKAYIFSNVLDNLYKPQKVGFGIFGFDVNHVHIHLVPMHDRDDIVPGYVLPNYEKIIVDEEFLNKTAKEIKNSYETRY